MMTWKFPHIPLISKEGGKKTDLPWKFSEGVFISLKVFYDKCHQNNVNSALGKIGFV